MEKEKYEKLIQVSFIDAHDWILINFHRSRKIYRMFDEIVFDEENV